jgi:thiamine biosynthesis protein ThiS
VDRADTITEVMTVKVNGQDRDVPAGTSIKSLLEQMKLNPNHVAVELNRRLVRAETYDTPLKERDEIEIVTFVGGG